MTTVLIHMGPVQKHRHARRATLLGKAFSPAARDTVDEQLDGVAVQQNRKPAKIKRNRANPPVLCFRVENGKLKATTKALPKLRPGWALVRVRLAGICNTDVELLHGYYNFCGVPGHEFVGTVEQLRGASAVENKKWLGRRVCGEINISCKALGRHPVCVFFRRGFKTHCTHRTVLGIIGHPGAYAQYLTLPVENLHATPARVNDQQAVFVEPLAAACEILEQVDVKKFREAAVLGDGKLAQLIARGLRTEIPRAGMYGKHEKKFVLARRGRVGARK